MTKKETRDLPWKKKASRPSSSLDLVENTAHIGTDLMTAKGQCGVRRSLEIKSLPPVIEVDESNHP